MAFLGTNTFKFIAGAAGSLLGGFRQAQSFKAAGEAAMNAARHNADLIKANRNIRLRDIGKEFGRTRSEQRATAATSGVSVNSASFNTVFQATASDFMQSLVDERNAAQNAINTEIYKGQLAKAQADAQAGQAIAGAVGSVISSGAEFLSTTLSDPTISTTQQSSPGGNVYKGYSMQDIEVRGERDPFVGFSPSSVTTSSYNFDFNDVVASAQAEATPLGQAVARQSGESGIDQVERALNFRSPLSSDVASSINLQVPAVSAEAIEAAHAATGADKTALALIARVESNFNPEARARTSSASGLFQFIDSTWEEMVQKFGAKHGITLQDKMNPRANAIMAGEFLKMNQAKLQSALGRQPTVRELYLAHFAGVGGAIKVLRVLAKNPYAPVSAGFTPAQIAANRGLLSGSLSKSVKKLTDKLFRGLTNG